MGQILHGSATTTYAIRPAIQRSKRRLGAIGVLNIVLFLFFWRRRAIASIASFECVLPGHFSLRALEWPPSVHRTNCPSDCAVAATHNASRPRSLDCRAVIRPWSGWGHAGTAYPARAFCLDALPRHVPEIAVAL